MIDRELPIKNSRDIRQETEVEYYSNTDIQNPSLSNESTILDTPIFDKGATKQSQIAMGGLDGGIPDIQNKTNELKSELDKAKSAVNNLQNAISSNPFGEIGALGVFGGLGATAFSGLAGKAGELSGKAKELSDKFKNIKKPEIPNFKGIKPPPFKPLKEFKQTELPIKNMKKFKKAEAEKAKGLLNKGKDLAAKAQSFKDKAMAQVNAVKDKANQLKDQAEGLKDKATGALSGAKNQLGSLQNTAQNGITNISKLPGLNK